MTGAVLASWNNAAAEAAILEFVKRTTGDGPEFVPVADRIASFDNDGTLWVEQPLPLQFRLRVPQAGEESKAEPSLASQQQYKAIIEKDPAFFEGVATPGAGRDRVAAQGVRAFVGRNHPSRVRYAGP
jgi:hypothetical protein